MAYALGVQVCAAYTLWNWTRRDIFQMGRARENNKKAGKIILYFPSRAIPGAHRMYSTALVLLQLWAALFQGWVGFIPLFVYIYQRWVCDIPGAHLPSSKPRNRQAIHTEPQCVSAAVNLRCSGTECISPLVVSIVHPWFCAFPGAHLGSTARIQRDISADCFCSCTVRCCRAGCVSLVGFNVQSDIFAVMIAWS